MESTSSPSDSQVRSSRCLVYLAADLLVAKSDGLPGRDERGWIVQTRHSHLGRAAAFHLEMGAWATSSGGIRQHPCGHIGILGRVIVEVSAGELFGTGYRGGYLGIEAREALFR